MELSMTLPTMLPDTRDVIARCCGIGDGPWESLPVPERMTCTSDAPHPSSSIWYLDCWG